MLQIFLIGISALLVIGLQDADAPDRQHERNAELEFMVGEWTTVHEVPSRDGPSTTFTGEALIDRAVGGTFVRHVWSGVLEGRGELHMMLMMNYSPAKMMFNCCLFDRSGGEPGIFHGDWIDESTLVVKAKFVEENGSESHQRFTFIKVHEDIFRLSRAFSDDGEHYHFEVTGTYTRKAADAGT